MNTSKPHLAAQLTFRFKLAMVALVALLALLILTFALALTGHDLAARWTGGGAVTTVLALFKLLSSLGRT